MRHRNYRIYWFGQIGSLVGAWMQSVAQPWLVLELGGSPLQLGTVLALMFAPSMFLAPIGGVIADRVDKRRVLMIVNAVAMLQAARPVRARRQRASSRSGTSTSSRCWPAS